MINEARQVRTITHIANVHVSLLRSYCHVCLLSCLSCPSESHNYLCVIAMGMGLSHTWLTQAADSPLSRHPSAPSPPRGTSPPASRRGGYQRRQKPIALSPATNSAELTVCENICGILTPRDFAHATTAVAKQHTLASTGIHMKRYRKFSERLFDTTRQHRG